MPLNLGCVRILAPIRINFEQEGRSGDIIYCDLRPAIKESCAGDIGGVRLAQTSLYGVPMVPPSPLPMSFLLSFMIEPH